MQAHILERILFVVIACTAIFAGLCLYTYLVNIYQSHWPHVLASHLGDVTGAWPTGTTSCISHARWALIESQQLDRGQSAAFQSHASFVLQAGAPAGDLETSRFLLFLRDRHASGIVYFDQSASASGAAAAAAVIEVKVEAFHESEEALRAKTRTICALRPSRDQYGIGVFAAGGSVPGHEYSSSTSSARDDIILKIAIWLPGPRVAEAHVPRSQRVMGDSLGDSPTHASEFGGQLSMPSMNAPIKINTPHPYMHGKCNDISSSLEPAAAIARPNIAVGNSTYINNNDLPLSIILTTTDAQIIRRICPADSKSVGFFCVSAHSLNNPLGIRFFGQAPDQMLDLGVNSTSGCNLGTIPLPGMEEPTEKSRNGCLKSRIVRHSICLTSDIE